MSRRVLFYVQHLLGIGHLSRTSQICAAMVKEGLDVKMVMGGTPVCGFPDETVNVHCLPVLKAGSFNFSDVTDETGKSVDRDYLDARRDELLALFESFRPDVLVIEAYPFGRRLMRFELLPLLERAANAEWQPVIVGSVRDIVQEKKKPERLCETVEILNKYFDVLMVHADPEFVKFGDSFEKADEIADLITYTGIVAAPVGPLSAPAFDVVVSAGGGAAGEVIMTNAIKAVPMTNLANASWLFLTGPNLSESVLRKLQVEQSANITIDTHRQDFRAVLAAARLSVSQAGYNTVADIMMAKCRSVLVPFASGGETEQTKRAEILAKQGLAEMVYEEEVSPQILARAINSALLPQTRPDENPLDLDGAKKSAKIISKARKRTR